MNRGNIDGQLDEADRYALAQARHTSAWCWAAAAGVLFVYVLASLLFGPQLDIVGHGATVLVWALAAKAVRAAGWAAGYRHGVRRR